MRAPFVVQAEDQGRMDLSHDAADAELVSGGTELHELVGGQSLGGRGMLAGWVPRISAYAFIMILNYL